MKPFEIKPDTQLCTIMGHNAQSGYRRRYFNRWLKVNGHNAAAIALNVTDDHFAFTMQNVASSKVNKMILEPEFGVKVQGYCDEVYGAKEKGALVDFIEMGEGKIVGYSLESEAHGLFGDSPFVDERIILVAKMMLIAARWYGVAIDTDGIPLLIENELKESV